ncbi:MAG: hypothetical protein ROO76_11115 [Terriglobia bacterium]|nr:hypothetical protein [Terriglobia bacterium]
MPGPWSDEMRSLSQCSLAPAAVAEDPERRCWGAPWALGVTILTKRPIRFPRIYSYSRLHMNSCPLPRQDASDRQDAPGGGTLVGEDSLRESGLRPLSHPSSQNQQDAGAAIIASRKELMQYRGKHHAKASRLRVWKQIA